MILRYRSWVRIPVRWNGSLIYRRKRSNQNNESRQTVQFLNCTQNQPKVCYPHFLVALDFVTSQCDVKSFYSTNLWTFIDQSSSPSLTPSENWLTRFRCDFVSCLFMSFFLVREITVYVKMMSKMMMPCSLSPMMNIFNQFWALAANL